MKFRYPAAVLVLTVVVGVSSMAQAIGRGSDVTTSPVTVRGTVNSVHPPSAVVLTDGTLVEMGAA